ncbi:serine/threonine protein kinase [Clostridium sporogenes]|uniref:serine/threonine-protein kinase n=1 Tax=Clostridium sporogenes TaxID=1509 RepID=UPI0013D7F2D7|nr:serine/threonine-protein kinase [Clostridium sporogenes]NFV11529.1 serine/threonine protein kinase [Clostridium sporogenes]
MENLAAECRLSFYKTLTILKENDKSKIFLVHHIENNNIYIKKVLTNYNIDIYKALQKFKNIHTPCIYEVLEFNNELILIEEFVNGDTLEKILEKSKSLTELKTIEYMLCICNILGELHSLKPPIIHRDIKPSNIIINNDGILKLIDYDVSRVYKKGSICDTVIMGTQEYASPEQFGFFQTDCRSDIYSMGVLMNVLTTGNYPKYKKNNEVLKDIIEKCIRISPEERYQSIKELKNDLKDKLIEMKKCNNKMNFNSKSTIVDHNKILNSNNRNIKYSIQKLTLRNFYKVIPGFRSGHTWKRIIACLWYSILITALFIYTGNSFLEDLDMVLFMLSLTCLYTNFLNIRNRLPLLKKQEIIFKILGYVLYTFILVMVFGGILSVINPMK